MLRPGFPRLSHPEVAHAIPSVGFMAQVYRRVRLLVSPTIVGVQLTDQQRTAQAPGVDGSRVIVACALTEPTAEDAITGISLVDEVDGHLTRVTADPAYDTLAFYGAAGARGARVVVPPTKTASLPRRGARSGARDRTIRRVKALGRRRWKQASGDHQHARVENAFFRYTSIVGDCLRARSSSGQRREAVLACNVLDRMTELGRPVSYRIGR